MNKKVLIPLIIFLVVNFGALGIGSFFTGSGVSSDWYQSLIKAPWTPPGWVFGAAWTLIMICFSIYMAILWTKLQEKKELLTLYIIQLVLNIGWNPLFFEWKLVLVALVCISLLTLLISFFIGRYRSVVQSWSLLLLPYAIWLCIATSLNAYILFAN